MSNEKKPSVNETEKSNSRQFRGLLTEFEFSVVSPNIIGGLVPAVTPAMGVPTPLATLPALTLNMTTDRVWLSGTVAWQAVVGTGTTVEFRVLRGATMIFNTADFETTMNAFATTSFNHVDFPATVGPVVYSLVVVVQQGSATFSGPVTLTGAQIMANTD